MSTTGFHLGTTLLFTLVSVLWASCLRSISCPCGTKGDQVYYTQCINSTLDENFACETWTNCETCEASLPYCLTCPPGRSGPTCAEESKVPTSCEYPEPEPNSRLITSISTDQILLPGTELIYMCDEGYETFDPLIMFCMNIGFWTSPPPTCKRIVPTTTAPTLVTHVTCPRPTVDPNGDIEYISPNDPTRREQEFEAGSQVGFTCKSGYQMNGPKSINCLGNGEWTSASPTCTRAPRAMVLTSEDSISCRYPEPEPNSRLTTPIKRDKILLPGTELIYMCNEGYETSDPLIIFCMNIGFWTSPPPICNKIEPTITFSPVSCDDPGVNENAFLENENDVDLDEEPQEYVPGVILRYLCADGYELVGSRNIVCTVEGKWSDEPPICRKVHMGSVVCLDLGTIKNGGEIVYYNSPNAAGASFPENYDANEYPVGTRIKYECENGYHLEGDSSLYCESDGFWSADVPKCIEDV